MKSFDINTIARPNIKSFTPYKVWRDKYLDADNFIFLDNCENNYGSPLGKGYERYPSSSQNSVKIAIAGLKKVNVEQLALGNGSDELIDLTIRCFCEPGRDNILICEPTFGMFNVYAQINNVRVLNAPLKKEDFTFDIDLILSSKNINTRIIFICSPNNPTGTSISKTDLIKLCEEFPGLVVLDEAYVDFSEKGSMIGLIEQIPNLLILQTFSKAWGLAALRLGCGIGSKDVINTLDKIRAPFNINGVTQQLVLKAIEKKAAKDQFIKKIIAQKNILKKQLLNMSFVEKIIESDANYFLLKVQNAKSIADYLLSKKILISNRSLLLNCENFVRISIGTEEENERLIKELKLYK